MPDMQLKPIQIFLCLTALSGCAGSLKPNAAAVPDVSLTKATSLASERKAPRAADVNSPNDVFFPSDDTKVDGRGQDVLRRHAQRLRQHPQEVVTLVGHADPLGSRSYNLALTEERLDSVTELLRSLGVARSQIRRASAGQTRMAGCDAPACRLPRVELIYER